MHAKYIGHGAPYTARWLLNKVMQGLAPPPSFSGRRTSVFSNHCVYQSLRSWTGSCTTGNESGRETINGSPQAMLTVFL